MVVAVVQCPEGRFFDDHDCRGAVASLSNALHERMAPRLPHSTTSARNPTPGRGDILAQWLGTRVLENIAAMDERAILHGQPNPARATGRRRFPWVDFYGDEPMAGGLPGHRHARMEFATVLEGRLHLGIGDQVYEARTGDWLVFAPHVLHGECCLPQRSRYALLWFSLEKERMGCQLTRYTRHRGYELIASMPHQRPPHELYAAALRLVAEPTETILFMRRTLVRLAAACLDALANQGAPEPAPAAHPSVKAAAQLVHDQLDRPPTVVELANQVGLSPNYLSSLFHQQTGQTLRAFMDAARIEQAQRMLAEAGRSVKQTAYQLGFADPHHFSRVFRRVTGQTPTQYRHGRREDADT